MVRNEAREEAVSLSSCLSNSHVSRQNPTFHLKKRRTFALFTTWCRYAMMSGEISIAIFWLPSHDKEPAESLLLSGLFAF